MNSSKKHHTVETIRKATNNDIDATIKKLKRPKCSKLSEKEKKLLEEVKVRNEIVITNADKGGAVVIMGVKDYVEECERQLDNIGNYNRLQKGPTATNNELVHSVIKRFETVKLFRQNIAEELKINTPRNPRFYTQPKIYKERNPGITVIRSVSSEYVYYHLQPIVKQIPSYVKDTSDFMSKLKAVETVPDNSYLVSRDVKSLYTNIPNSEGIKAVKT